MSTGDRLLGIAAGLLLAVVGIGLGTIEAFLVPVRIFGGIEGLVVVIAVVGNLGLGLLAAYGLGSPSAPLVPAAGWFVAASYFIFPIRSRSFPLHSLSTVVPGRLPHDPGVPMVGLLWYFGGVLAFVAVFFTASIWVELASKRYTKRTNTPKPDG